MMKKFFLAIVFQLSIVAALAQQQQPATFSVLPSSTPGVAEILRVLDQQGNWLPMGSFQVGGPYQPTGSYITPMQYQAIGNGINDDTAHVQAAFDDSVAKHVMLFFDDGHLYNITSSLNAPSPIHIEGAYRFGFWTTTPNNQRYCPWGLTTTSNIDVINASAVTGIIKNLCIQAGANTGSGVSATAGAAIKLAPPSITTYQTGWHLEGNTLLNVYDGISIDGVGATSVCCGAGTAADGVSVERNTIVNPNDAGISIGKNTSGSATVGITVRDNAIGCINSTSKATGVGVALYDGGIWYDGTQNGPEGCHIGIAVRPGTAGGSSQKAQLDATGVLGDQSGSHDLLIEPLTSLGNASYFDCNNCWAGGTTTVDNEVLIDNPNGGVIYNLTFRGGTFHSGVNQTVPVIDVEGINSGSQIYNLIFNGMSIDCWLSTSPCGIGMRINGSTPGSILDVNVTGNRIGSAESNPSGKFATALSLNTNAGGAYFNITGNILRATTGFALTTPASGNASSVTFVGNSVFDTTTPIAYTPNPADVVTIQNNNGVDNVCPTVTVTSNSITLPNASLCVIITTSGTPNVTSIGPPWVGRRVEVQSSTTGGFTMSFDGSAQYPICRNVTVAQSQVVELYWRNTGTCWTTSL
jgi:hypothetical protein